MSKVTEKYFQDCDLCGKNVELPTKTTSLFQVKLPCQCVNATGNAGYATAEFSLCDSCFLELKNFLNTKYVITHHEYCSPFIDKISDGEEE